MVAFSKRNIIVVFSNFLSGAFLICFLGLLFVLSKDLPQTFLELLIAPNILIPTISIIYSVLSVYFIRKFFLKHTRAEIFFFLLFLLTINFDGIRSVVFIFEQLDKPVAYSMLLTRVAYFGKILGIFSLLSFALMSNDSEYKPFTALCSIAVILSMFLANLMPFSPVKGTNALFLPGQAAFGNSMIFLMIITFILLVSIFIQNRNFEYLNMAVSVIFMFVGSSVLFYSSTFLPALFGLILLTAGTVFISYRIHRLYLWD